MITVENTEGYTGFQRKAIDLLLESPVFGLTWDIGHSHTAGDADEAYILQNEKKFTHFHIHDAHGQQNHMTLGSGRYFSGEFEHNRTE